MSDPEPVVTSEEEEIEIENEVEEIAEESDKSYQLSLPAGNTINTYGLDDQLLELC
jgi:hypothetical protein